MKRRLTILPLALLLGLGITACTGIEDVNYTVTFDANFEGGSKTTSEVKSGDKVARPTDDPTRDHYSFDDWYINSTASTKFNFDTVITSDVTVYANWTVNTFKVEFDFNYEGSVNFEDTVESGKSVSRPEDPIRVDYNFDNWYIDNLATTVFDFSSFITGNITIYANWTPVVRHTVSFHNNDATATILNVEVVDGERVNEPENPVLDGYEFVGWFNSDLVTPFDFSAPITDDMIIEAVYSRIIVWPQTVLEQHFAGVVFPTPEFAIRYEDEVDELSNSGDLSIRITDIDDEAKQYELVRQYVTAGWIGMASNMVISSDGVAQLEVDYDATDGVISVQISTVNVSVASRANWSTRANSIRNTWGLDMPEPFMINKVYNFYSPRYYIEQSARTEADMQIICQAYVDVYGWEIIATADKKNSMINDTQKYQVDFVYDTHYSEIYFTIVRYYPDANAYLSDLFPEVSFPSFITTQPVSAFTVKATGDNPKLEIDNRFANEDALYNSVFSMIEDGWRVVDLPNGWDEPGWVLINEENTVELSLEPNMNFNDYIITVQNSSRTPATEFPSDRIPLYTDFPSSANIPQPVGGETYYFVPGWPSSSIHITNLYEQSDVVAIKDQYILAGYVLVSETDGVYLLKTADGMGQVTIRINAYSRFVSLIFRQAV